MSTNIGTLVFIDYQPWMGHFFFFFGTGPVISCGQLINQLKWDPICWLVGTSPN